MIESVSCNELYEKFHELYIAVIKHIICNITITKEDGTVVDAEMLERVQEYCLDAFDELNRVKYKEYEDELNTSAKAEYPNFVNVSAPTNVKYYDPARPNTLHTERSVLAVLTYTISSTDDDKFLPFIQEKYKAKLTEEEFNILGELFEIVSEQLYGILSLSCKFLVATHDIEL